MIESGELLHHVASILLKIWNRHPGAQVRKSFFTRCYNRCVIVADDSRTKDQCFFYVLVTNDCGVCSNNQTM